ncbi:Uncharacterised protein [Legionella beliardensis]|uniref:Coiled-coil protein n=1 Tax=Legionella beliardensis TaxID=91822 RepID=A0A378I426_9GAMM|nr:hypothetical protein [Legionella beliardensis]STX29465.1 Uncharacterised protein [Legionella beliardensis]
MAANERETIKFIKESLQAKINTHNPDKNINDILADVDHLIKTEDDPSELLEQTSHCLERLQDYCRENNNRELTREVNKALQNVEELKAPGLERKFF